MSHAYAAIDSGSNTFRMLIAKPAEEHNKLPWHTIHYDHRIIRLAEGLQQHGALSEAAMVRALNGYREFAKALAEHNIPQQRLMAVATAAVREASNGHVFAARVQSETGIQLQIIDGNQEAAWSLQGACAVLPPEIQRSMLLFDIGGGSTECIRAYHGVARDAISRKIGVVKLFETHVHSDPPNMKEYNAMLAATEQHLAAVEASWKENSTLPEHLVGTAGTVTTIAAMLMDMKTYCAERINNYTIEKQDFLQLRDQLLAMTYQERAAMTGMDAGRADLIIAGIAIMETMMKRWGYDAIITTDASLLEGAWMAAQSK